MNVAIVNSGGANITSVRLAFTRLGAQTTLTADPEVIQQASHVLLPGVGTAQDAMARLTELNLLNTLRSLTQPVLGICLGMQLLYESSTEGDATCLGIIPGDLNKLRAEPGITVPHMGWNKLQLQNDSPLLKNVEPGDYVYFVHSFAAPVNDFTTATSQHGRAFTACCQRDNFFGMQFHPERSGAVGSKMLANFLAL